MTNIEIILLHRQLYAYLKTLHDANPNFLFWAVESQDGLWFKHVLLNNNIIIFVMFEEGFQKNYRLRLFYDGHKQCWSCSIALPASELITKKLESLGYAHTGTTWNKELLSSNDFLAAFKDFIKNEKPIIEVGLEKKEVPAIEIQFFKQKIEQIEQFYKRPPVQEYFRLAADNGKPHLPFALSRLEVIGFQGITNLLIENLPTDKQWIFLTGENGFGKTSILKAIAKALAGDEDFIASLPADSHLTINGYHWNQPFYYEAKPKQLPKHDFQMATYGVSRFQVSKIDSSEFSTSKYGKKTYSLFNDDGYLMNIDRFLMDKERDDEPTFQRLKQIFLKIIPNLADIRSVVTNKNRRILYYEKSDSGESYAPVYLSELAAGYRGILTLIGDMVQRLSEHPNNSLEDLQGVVLIDEFDAHLHPKYQYELPNLLSEVFPKIQFIVATHSPIPILGVKPNTSAVLTVHRTKSAGVTVERFDDDIDIQRLSVNALLTSDIFNFGHIFARGATPEMIEPFDNYERIKAMTQMEKLLQLKKVLNRIQ